MIEARDTPRAIRVRSVVEKVVVGRDVPLVLCFTLSLTTPPTFRLHPSSEGWTMGLSAAVVLAESHPIRRMNKFNLYGNVRTNMERPICRMKMMHVKR